MARIIASLLHRPSPDKSKRVARIPVGGHTEKTLLRGLNQHVAMIDEANFFPEVATEPVLFDAEDPETIEAFRALPEVFEEIIEPAPEVAIVEKVPSEAEVIVDVVPLMVEVVDATPVQVDTPPEEEVKEDLKEETPPEEEVKEEVPLEKFDYDAFLAQKAPVIKTALATGDHDHHLDALTEFETTGADRKNVLGYIAGRVKV